MKMLLLLFGLIVHSAGPERLLRLHDADEPLLPAEPEREHETYCEMAVDASRAAAGSFAHIWDATRDPIENMVDKAAEIIGKQEINFSNFLRSERDFFDEHTTPENTQRLAKYAAGAVAVGAVAYEIYENIDAAKEILKECNKTWEGAVFATVVLANGRTVWLAVAPPLSGVYDTLQAVVLYGVQKHTSVGPLIVHTFLISGTQVVSTKLMNLVTRGKAQEFFEWVVRYTPIRVFADFVDSVVQKEGHSDFQQMIDWLVKARMTPFCGSLVPLLQDKRNVPIVFAIGSIFFGDIEIVGPEIMVYMMQTNQYIFYTMAGVRGAELAYQYYVNDYKHEDEEQLRNRLQDLHPEDAVNERFEWAQRVAKYCGVARGAAYCGVACGAACLASDDPATNLKEFWGAVFATEALGSLVTMYANGKAVIFYRRIRDNVGRFCENNLRCARRRSAGPTVDLEGEDQEE